MQVDLIETVDALRKLEPAWEALWTRDAHADIFASFPWFLNWWEHFGHGAGPAALVVRKGDDVVPIMGRGARLQVVVVWNHGEPVAILPLILIRGWWQRCPVRILAPPLNHHAPRSGFLPSRMPEGAMAAVVEYLSRNRSWDLLLLDGIPRASGFVPALSQMAATRGLRGSMESPWTHSYLPLDGTWDEYLTRQGGHFRKHLRQTHRALEQLGSLAVERYEGSGQVTGGMRLFLEIDRESWKAVDGESVALHPSLQGYYTELATRLATHGRCEVWVLRMGSHPIAAILCLRDQRALYILKSSYKDQFGSARYSPSLVLIARILQSAWERQFTGVDFVGRTPFLERWTTDGLEFDRLIVFKRRRRERVVRLLESAMTFAGMARGGLGRWLRQPSAAGSTPEEGSGASET